MPGWLTTAANVFRKQAPAPVQTYSVRCGCGRVAEGTRTDSAQETVCPACRSSLFIFPASVYPALQAPPPKPKKNTPVRQSPAKGGTARGKTTPGAAAPTKGRTQALSPRAGERQPQTAEPAGPKRHRKLVSPLRVVLASLVLVVMGTVWWLFHLRALDRARETIATAPRVAEEALQEGDLPEAARQYDRIREAVARLGRDDPQARRWNQLAKETAALSDLATAPLHAILQEAVDASTSGTDSIWKQIFQETFRGGWVLIDAPVSRSVGNSGGDGFQIDYPLTAGENSARLIADLPDFRLRVAEGASAGRVIFAVQLADCRKDSSGEGDWRIEFQPDTGFLWSSAETYAMVGMPTDEGSLAVLAEQSHLLGIEP